MQTPQQMYMKTKSDMHRLLNNPSMISTFGQKNARTLKDALEIMFEQLDELVRDRRVIPTDRERSVIATATNALLRSLVYDPITPFLKDFTMLYLEITKNWNNQIGYQYDIDLWLDTIQRLVECHLTIKDAIEVMKAVTQKCKRLFEYEPPAFTLARHYMSVIQEKMEKNEPINEYEKAKANKSEEGERDA